MWSYIMLTKKNSSFGSAPSEQAPPPDGRRRMRDASVQEFLLRFLEHQLTPDLFLLFGSGSSGSARVHIFRVGAFRSFRLNFSFKGVYLHLFPMGSSSAVNVWLKYQQIKAPTLNTQYSGTNVFIFCSIWIKTFHPSLKCKIIKSLQIKWKFLNFTSQI